MLPSLHTWSIIFWDLPTVVVVPLLEKFSWITALYYRHSATTHYNCIKIISDKSFACKHWPKLFKLTECGLVSNDPIWRHRSGSMLAQVMAWCLTAPSHYLNQRWLLPAAFYMYVSKAADSMILLVKNITILISINLLWCYLGNYLPCTNAPIKHRETAKKPVENH